MLGTPDTFDGIQDAIRVDLALVPGQGAGGGIPSGLRQLLAVVPGMKNLSALAAPEAGEGIRQRSSSRYPAIEDR
jgi:hypothetical protein